MLKFCFKISAVFFQEEMMNCPKLLFFFKCKRFPLMDLQPKFHQILPTRVCVHKQFIFFFATELFRVSCINLTFKTMIKILFLFKRNSVN